jgi:hypothetical protein
MIASSGYDVIIASSSMIISPDNSMIVEDAPVECDSKSDIIDATLVDAAECKITGITEI